MRAADPNLTLLAAATPSRDWTLPLLKAAGQQLHYVAIHNYWLPCWGENLTPDYLACVLHATGPEKTISQVIDLLQESGCRGRVKIAFDEWNLRGWHHPGFPRKEVTDPSDRTSADLIRAREKNAIASQYSMADALFSAAFMNACLRHASDVGMANIAPIVNTRGPLFVHPQGLVKRTTFHVLSMYANQLENEVAAVQVDSVKLTDGKASVPAIDAIATIDSERNSCALALINLHPTQTAACTVNLKDLPLTGVFPATVLSGDSTDAYNEIARPDRVVPVKTDLSFDHGTVHLAPHSLTIVKVPLK